jgi:hypothetical protein
MNKFNETYESIKKNLYEADLSKDYERIINASMEEHAVPADRRKLISDLLYMLKEQKHVHEKVKEKFMSLMQNPLFAKKYIEIALKVQTLKVDVKELATLERKFQEMIENANYEERKKFIDKYIKFLVNVDDVELRKLHDIESEIVKLINSFA